MPSSISTAKNLLIIVWTIGLQDGMIVGSIGLKEFSIDQPLYPIIIHIFQKFQNIKLYIIIILIEFCHARPTKWIRQFKRCPYLSLEK